MDLTDGTWVGSFTPTASGAHQLSAVFLTRKGGGGSGHSVCYLLSFCVVKHFSPPPSEGALWATYYGDGLLTTPSLNRLDPPPPFDWGGAAPMGVGSADMFSARWGGWFLADTSATHTFELTADDGARLYLADATLIDAWTTAPLTAVSATVSLTACERLYTNPSPKEFTPFLFIRANSPPPPLPATIYSLRLDYREDYGAARVGLTFSAGGSMPQPILTSRLFYTATHIGGSPYSISIPTGAKFLKINAFDPSPPQAPSARLRLLSSAPLRHR